MLNSSSLEAWSEFVSHLRQVLAFLPKVIAQRNGTGPSDNAEAFRNVDTIKPGFFIHNSQFGKAVSAPRKKCNCRGGRLVLLIFAGIAYHENLLGLAIGH